MPDITVWMAKYEGTVQLLTLYLYDDTDGSLINTGGDELAEVTNGYFSSTVNDVLPTNKMRAVVKGGTEPLWEGWLHDGTTQCTTTDVVGSTTEPPTTAEITAAVWSELQAGYTTVGTFGYYLDQQVSIVSTGGIVTPIFTNTPDPVEEATLEAYVGETRTFTVYPRDSMNSPIDLTGTVIEIVVEDRATGTDLELIADGAITKTPDSYTFTTSANTNADTSQKTWSTRTTTSKLVVGHGEYVVNTAALGD